MGYGDVSPRTAAGRVVAAALIIIGVSFFGLLTANLATYFLRHHKGQAPTREDIERIHACLDRIEGLLAARQRGDSDGTDD